MIPIVINETLREERGEFRIARTMFWVLLITFTILDRMIMSMPSMMYSSGPTGWSAIVLIGSLFLAYARIKDSGLHGLHTFWAIIPFGLVIIGCLPTDYQWAQPEYKSAFRKRATAWILVPTAIGICAAVFIPMMAS